jgi:hypothetical protein
VTTTADGPFRLDLLVGEVEAEAARRRAAPGYPHELEAQIEAELARQAPTPTGRLSLDRLVTSVEEAAFINIDAPATASRREFTYLKGALKRGLAWYLRHVANQVSTLGFATARTLRAVTSHIAEIEERLAALEGAGEGANVSGLPAHDEPAGYLSSWLEEVSGQLKGLGGRVLYADADADPTVAALRAAGLDAYGLTREGSPYQLSPDIRHGDLVAHLDSVGEGALGAVMLAGCADAMDGSSLKAVVERLTRTVGNGGGVVVVAEAPWWWRIRLGPEAADLADARPLAAETWLAALHRAGFEGTAAYADDGRSYAVFGQREAGPEPR